MGLDTILRSAVKTAQRVTISLQASVSHEPFVSQNGYGESAYGAAVTRTALVEHKQRLVKTSEGREVVATELLTFLGDVAVTTRDRITLPGGLTAPIVAIEGVMDPVSGRPYATVVSLGQ